MVVGTSLGLTRRRGFGMANQSGWAIIKRFVGVLVLTLVLYALVDLLFLTVSPFR